MPVPIEWDFKKPDYVAAFRWRQERLAHLRQKPERFAQLAPYYKLNPIAFINDWGCTLDPRNIEIGRPVLVPFFLYPHQEDWIEWVLDLWHQRKSGVVAKSRAVGLTWLAVALSISLGLYNDGFTVGFGSRKEEYVDKGYDPKSIFHKARSFILTLPEEFRGGFLEKRHTSHMKLIIPNTGSTLNGEAGTSIGRGARTSIYFKDESAHYENPKKIDQALSQTSYCAIDISTPNGTNNPFYEKYNSQNYPRFRFHWRDDPTKDDAWYQKECERLLDPVLIAQEIDMDFYASVANNVIPYQWVTAAIDAHIKLNIPITGIKRASLDIGDQGDENALGMTQGIVLNKMEVWSGKDSDIFKTCQKACGFLDQWGCEIVKYDADGLGAAARGDAREINIARAKDKKKSILFLPFHAGGAVINPQGRLRIGKMEAAHPNIDFFDNLKAQGWWSLRWRFLLTYKAVVGSHPFDPESIISLSSELKDLPGLMAELAQPTYDYGKTGKIKIDKKPEGARSPNRADSIMMAYAPEKFRGF